MKGFWRAVCFVVVYLARFLYLCKSNAQRIQDGCMVVV